MYDDGDEPPELMNDSDSQSQRYVCWTCIGDPYLRPEIKLLGGKRSCTYCGALRKAVALEVLAARVDSVFQQLVTAGDEYPVVVEDSDNVHWTNEGDYPEQLMTEFIESDIEDIAHDLVGELSRQNAYAVVHDGAWDYYDDTADHYVIRIPRDTTFGHTWAEFTRSIQHERRFFNEEAGHALSSILDPVIRGEWPKSGSAIRVLEPDEGIFLYRGRVANDEADRRTIYRSPIKKLAAPPPNISTPGRMNRAGISVFYGSLDPTTCVAELRAPVGGIVIVGKFAPLRPLRLLDLTALEGASFPISYFDPEFLRNHAYNDFLRGFHGEIKKPILPHRETLDYLPTQVVAEYLWTRGDPVLDGVIYGSAQLSAGGNNLVLFPHAAVVDGYKQEREREIHSIASWHEEDTSEYVFLEPDTPDVDPLEADWGREPSLKLLPNDIRIVRVTGISYEVESGPVTLADWTDPYPDLKPAAALDDDLDS